jgi:TetR/AcrR family transcriptional regulator
MRSKNELENVPMNTRRGNANVVSKRIPKTPAKIKRAKLEQDILRAAEVTFSIYGFHGISIEDIASSIGISKQNLLYYFPTKAQLYHRVLEGVTDDWLNRLTTLAHANDDPAGALRAYIKAKLNFSRERPHASRLYANEVIAGAPRYSAEIKARVVPALKAAIETLEALSRDRRVEPVDMTHLMFIIWASTQAYADFARQMELVLGRKKLIEADFEAAESLILRMVLRTLDLA